MLICLVRKLKSMGAWGSVWISTARWFCRCSFVNKPQFSPLALFITAVPTTFLWASFCRIPEVLSDHNQAEALSWGTINHRWIRFLFLFWHFRTLSDVSTIWCLAMSRYQSRLPEVTVYFGPKTSLDKNLVKTPLWDHRMVLRQHSKKQHGEGILKTTPTIISI